MGESATPVGNAKTCRLPGLYTGTGRHEHTEGSKEPGGHWAPPARKRQARKAQRCRDAFPFPTQYIVPRGGIWAGWASCFETAAGLLSERKSLPSPSPAPTIPPAQPSPPITMLLLLTIQHPAGSPAAPRCTKYAREAPARAHCCAALCCSGLRICNRAAQASRLCSREAQLTSIKSDAPQDRLVAAAAAAGRITGTGTRHVH